MADDEAPQCKVEYNDLPDGSIEETNWIKRAGKAKVTYPNGHVFEGTFDAEKIKQGPGLYIWMGPGSEEDETPVEKARYEGHYKHGMKHGIGKMTFPNGDIYEGEWHENKIHGEGTYTYKKSGDIYSGSWHAGQKHGQGRYEYGADSSMLVGTWDSGNILHGAWELKGAAVYNGEFKMGRPYGAGKFSFASGLSQTGNFVEVKKTGDEEEEPVEGDGPKAPNVAWKGVSIVSL